MATGLWELLRKVDTPVLNPVFNPSFETGTTGWTTVGTGTLTAVNMQDEAIGAISHGPTAGKVVTTVAGFYVYTTFSGFYTFRDYWYSIDIYSATGSPVKIWAEAPGGALMAGPLTITPPANKWARYELVLNTSNQAAVRLAAGLVSGTGTFYVDSIMANELGPNLSYVDGDQPGCRWIGIPHASQSEGDNENYNVGQWVNFDDFSFAVQEWQGVGMPPVKNLTVKYGLADGSYYQRTKYLERVFVLTGVLNVAAGATLVSLHTIRDNLIKAISPNRFDTPSPVWIRYLGVSSVGTTPRIAGLYAGGLDMTYNAKMGFTETIGLQFLANNPFWAGDRGHTAYGVSLAAIGDDSVLRYREPSGLWTLRWSLTGTPATVNAIVFGPDNKAYIGGVFGGTLSNIAVYDPNANTLTNVGTGGANGAVYTLRFYGPDTAGYRLYAGGAFTTIGGVAAADIAVWNGSAWAALGTGLNNYPTDIQVAPDGVTVYVGGLFTTAGGITVNYVAKWTGAAWAALSTGLAGKCGALAIGPDGKLYATEAIAGGKVKVWDGATWTVIGTPAGGIAQPEVITFGIDGNLYLGGTFSSINGVAANNTAVWNGVAWAALGAGIAGSAGGTFTMALTDPLTNNIWFCGMINAVNWGSGATQAATGAAFWDGSVWKRLNLAADSSYPGTMALDSRGGIMLGSAAAVTQFYQPGYFSITNTGSADAYPIFTFTLPATVGPAHLVEIRNLRTGDYIQFGLDIMGVASTNLKEKLTLNLTPGNVSLKSNLRGDLTGFILPGSNVSSFRLLPGKNALYILGYNTAPFIAVRADVVYQDRELSLDGGVS